MQRMRVVSLVVILMLVLSGMSSLAFAQSGPGSSSAAQTGTTTPEAGAGNAGAGSTGGQFASASETVRQAFDLLGAPVENADGDEIGEIDNLLVVPSTGQIPYALLSAGGFLGLGETLTVIPFNEMRFDTERDVFILDVDEEVLQDGPTLRRYTSPNTRELSRNPEFQEFWNRFTGSQSGIGIDDAGGVDLDVLATVTPESDSGAAGAGAGAGTPGSTTGTGADAAATGSATDAAQDEEMGQGGAVRVGGMGQGVAGAAADEDLVRLTELGDFEIVTEEETELSPSGAGETGGIDATDPMTGTGGIDTTDPMTGTGGIDATDPMTGTGGIDATDPMTGTDTTDQAGDNDDNVIDLADERDAVATVDDVVIDVEAAQLLYVVATLDRTVFGGVDPGVDVNETATPRADTTGTGGSADVMGTPTPDAGGAGLTSPGAMSTITPDMGASPTGMTGTTGITGTGATTAGQTGDMAFDRLMLPWRALSLDIVDEVFYLNVSLDQLAEAPVMVDRRIDFTSSDWEEEISSFWTSAMAGAGTDQVTTGATPPTGRRTARNLTTQAGVLMQAQQIAGTAVLNTTGEELGEIDVLLISSAEGTVAYGVLSYGGFLGLGEKQVAVPWSAYRFNPAETNFVVNITSDELDEAPALESLDPSTIGTPGWDAEVQDFWAARGEEVPDTSGTSADATDMTTTGTRTPDSGASGTGDSGAAATGTRTPDTGATGVGADSATDTPSSADAGQAGSRMMLVRHDRLIGAEVAGPNGAVADVSDLLIQVETGQILHVILSYGGGFLGLGENSVPVPWNAIQFSLADDDSVEFTIDADESRLESAPQLELDPLPESVDADWDSEVRSYWGTGSNE